MADSKDTAPKPMQKFLVAFKQPKRQFKIDAQDDAQAHLWAEEQLKVWKTKSKYVVTPIITKKAAVAAADDDPKPDKS